MTMAPPFRVHISLMKFAPYPQRADLSVEDRLATVDRADEQTFYLTDDSGTRHEIDRQTLSAAAPSPDVGRWVIQQPIPTFVLGEEVTIAWRYRNGCTPIPPHETRPDRSARVVEEMPAHILVEDDQGERHRLFRFGVEEVRDGRKRSDPRWRIIGRISTIL